MVKFNWHPFSELTTAQLYDILILRSEIFVVEQSCPYLDPDGHDTQALHLLGTENNKLVTYLRLFPPNPTENKLIFGRVVTAKSSRKKGYGKKLMEELLSYCDTHFPGTSIHCSAQTYVKKFYEDVGFTPYGNVYDEDGIPHIAMQRNIEIQKYKNIEIQKTKREP